MYCNVLEIFKVEYSMKAGRGLGLKEGTHGKCSIIFLKYDNGVEITGNAAM